MMRRSLQCLALCASVALAGCATATPDVTEPAAEAPKPRRRTTKKDE